MFSGILSVVANIFGTESSSNKVFSIIDNAFNTEQEKQSHYLEWIKTTTGSRLARRVLGIMTMVIYFFAFLLMFIMAIIMAESGGGVAAGLIVVDQFKVPYLAGLVMVFYFTAGMNRKDS